MVADKSHINMVWFPDTVANIGASSSNRQWYSSSQKFKYKV